MNSLKSVFIIIMIFNSYSCSSIHQNSGITNEENNYYKELEEQKSDDSGKENQTQEEKPPVLKPEVNKDFEPPNILITEPKKKIILNDIYKLYPNKEEKINFLVRYLSENELIYFYYILSGLKDKYSILEEILDYDIHFNRFKIIISDIYVKISLKDSYYNSLFYISYPKTYIDDKTYYEGKKDNQYYTVSLSIPQEAEEGGDKSSFVQYDYVKEYWFKKNYPEEISSIVEVIKKLAADIDYDFKKAYGKKCKIRPGKIGVVCDGYTDYTTKYISKANIPGVSKIYKITSKKMNHAWNEIVFDSKTLYIDSTWFDINQIGDDGFSVNLPSDVGRDFGYMYITFDKNIFNKGFSGKKYSHYLGNDTRKKLVWSKK